MEFSNFVQWAFYGIIGACAVNAVTILTSMKNSIYELNTKIAVIIEKTSTHEKRLDNHDKQLDNLKK